MSENEGKIERESQIYEPEFYNLSLRSFKINCSRLNKDNAEPALG